MRQKRAVSGLVCLQHKEMSYGQKEVEKEVWRSKLGQMLEGFDYLAKKFKLPLLGIGELLKIWGNRLMWHYQRFAFIRFVNHYIEVSRI